MTNFYDVLGVSKDADESEIKKAYRKLSLQYHPDRNTEENTTSKFQEINEAFEVLSDPGKKQQYDMELQFGGGGGFPGMGGMDQDMSDINNIFNMMFGGMGGGFPGMGGMGGMPGVRIFHSGGGGPGMHTQFFHSFGKPEPIQREIEITLEQAYTGYSMVVDIERWCIINNNRTTEKETINIQIPQGIDHGETFVLENKGNNINNQVRGDIRLIINIKNDTDFVRKGSDLYLQKEISLKEALCGFVFEFEHINGKKISMNNTVKNNIIRPNAKKVINGMGMIRNGNTGNLIIEFDIKFPDTLSDIQKDSLRNIL